MKITLSKKVTLNVATAYLKIKKDVKRPDIQEYLKGRRFENNLINKRIDDYLENIGIFSDSGELTQFGEKVKNSGLFPTYEEGKYKIWFTEEDSYFGSRILYFCREMPRAGEQIDNLDLFFEDENFLMPSKEKDSENDFTRFSLVEKHETLKKSRQQESIDVSLILEDEKNAFCYFSGNIGYEGKIKLNDSKAVEREEILKDIIGEILPYWNEKNERLKIRFEDVDDEKNRKSFEIQQYQCQWKDFSGKIDTVKLMPFDEENAVKWRDHLLISKIRESYLSTEDFERSASEISENPAFENYVEDLEIPAPEKFAEYLRDDKSAWWHLNAPVDLNPNSLFNIEHAITLLKDESTSFSEIIQKIGVSLNNELVVFYDRYIIDDKQQKAVAAFMRSVNANKKIIITDMSQNKSSFIEKNCKDIRMRDFNQGIFSGPKAHDRYLIVVSNGKTKVWVITSSLMDKIIFPKNKDIDADSSGKVKGNVTITPIDEKDLDKDLANFVKGAKNGK